MLHFFFLNVPKLLLIPRNLSQLIGLGLWTAVGLCSWLLFSFQLRLLWVAKQVGFLLVVDLSALGIGLSIGLEVCLIDSVVLNLPGEYLFVHVLYLVADVCVVVHPRLFGYVWRLHLSHLFEYIVPQVPIFQPCRVHSIDSVEVSPHHVRVFRFFHSRWFAINNSLVLYLSLHL